jgi:hypothetical protein
MSDSATIVQKLWNYCNVLRDDGLSYQDYIEQLTFLLFLKMADEQAKPPFNSPSIVPDELDWAALGQQLPTDRVEGPDLTWWQRPQCRSQALCVLLAVIAASKSGGLDQSPELVVIHRCSHPSK